MIQLAFINSEKRAAAAHGALRSVGLTCRVCVFSLADLTELKAPVLLVFDHDADPRLTPEALQNLRRAPDGGARFSPALVFCPDKRVAEAWRASGALALPEPLTVDDIIIAAQHALAGQPRWISSPGYVGPDRRIRQAFGIKRRRNDDLTSTLKR